MQTLFRQHLATLLQRAEEALAATGFESLVISSGTPHTYFADDQAAPFRTVPHFARWCPLQGPHHLLHVRPGHRPRLIRHAPEDYWYEQAPLGDPFWADGFEIREVGAPEAAWDLLDWPTPAAYLGDEVGRAVEAGLMPNPRRLTARLDWSRTFKTPYEVACLEEATARSARGHRAAEGAFREGASELEIHHAYVRAVGAVDADLPYGSIVALDEKGAILHYEGKRPDVRRGAVLLIDAGASHLGYASDITRTHTAPRCDPRFRALHEGLERIELELCALVRPGAHFPALHEQAHLKLAELLVEHRILRTRPEAAVAAGYTRAFFPCGLGHHLGLQVHDVAGRQLDAEGSPAPQPPQHPYLRTTHTLAEGHVVTIEPGIYFMPMLLRPFRGNAAFGWDLIEALAPLGGIRVEDDVLVTADGHRNLTREHLPERAGEAPFDGAAS